MSVRTIARIMRPTFLDEMRNRSRTRGWDGWADMALSDGLEERDFVDEKIGEFKVRVLVDTMHDSIDKLPQNQPERINVGFWRCFVTQNEFWTNIKRSSAHFEESILVGSMRILEFTNQSGCAKISNFKLIVLGDKDIERL